MPQADQTAWQPCWRHATAVHRVVSDAHLIQVGQLELGILEGLLHRNPAPVQQVTADGLKLGSAEIGLDVLGALSSGGDEGQGDGGLGHTGQLHLGLLSCLCQPLQRLHPAKQIHRSACRLCNGITSARKSAERQRQGQAEGPRMAW